MGDLSSLYDAILGDPVARAGASGILAFALVEALKRSIVPSWKLWQLAALASALGINLLAEAQSGEGQWIRALLFGLIGGLLAAGIYEAAKNGLRGGKALMKPGE